MAWFRYLLAFPVVFAAATGAAFLSLAWKRRRKISNDAATIESRLPGHDCALCGFEGCREYAVAIESSGADPGLCAPGGAERADSLRRLLMERGNDPRSIRMKAVVRCGGTRTAVKFAFDYDGREDCASAVALYGGPKLCKDGCLGYGSCANACPLGAIRVRDGVAVVDDGLCTGCGACVSACPKGLVSLITADTPWFVACSSTAERSERKASCSAACDACGECVKHAMRNEFVIEAGIARAVPVNGGAWADVAPRCPSGAIRSAIGQKKADPPFGRSDAKL